MIEKIKKEKVNAIKTKNETKKKVTSILIGELQRTKKLEQFSDDEVVSQIWKLIKEERDKMAKMKVEIVDNEYIICLKSFIPNIVSEKEITDFIKTIDISKLKNKMQIVGMVKKKFGENNIDTEIVKSIIERI